MNRTRKAAVSLAIAAGTLIPIGFATSAHAIPVPVTHDGCTLTADKPAFNGNFTAGGVKKADYVYHLSCNASASGVSVEVLHERWEQDLAGRAGDPDAIEDFQNSSTQNLSYGPAGGNKNRTIRVALPIGDDDTDGNYEVYQKVKFRVTSGAVTGTWSPAALSEAQRIWA
jgi:hypothetical protein